MAQAEDIALFFEACEKGDVDLLRTLLAKDSSLVRSEKPGNRYRDWTGLHTAAQRGHIEPVRLLLDQGADPNAREEGDNTYPLHWAAAGGHLETARALLDAGGDVHGFGDVHELDVIGWATVWRCFEGRPAPDMVAFLLQRGARHHIFSALSTEDAEVVRNVVAQNPEALQRRLSRFEKGQTPLHFAIGMKRYDLLDLLIELGADLEGTDLDGHTALEAAMLRGEVEPAERLIAAGARQPANAEPQAFPESMSALADSIQALTPMIHVPDVAEALEWYKSIGFTEVGRYEDNGLVNWGMVSFGKAELMLNMHGKKGNHDVSLWFHTNQIDRLYQLLKSRQLSSVKRRLAGEASGGPGIEFVEFLYEPPYGGKQFGIRDLNGYHLYFLQQ
jgi:ankyrin repeat protein